MGGLLCNRQARDVEGGPPNNSFWEHLHLSDESDLRLGGGTCMQCIAKRISNWGPVVIMILYTIYVLFWLGCRLAELFRFGVRTFVTT